LVLAVLVKRTTRLLALAQVAAVRRRVGTVKSAAMALGYFLQEAQFPMQAFATHLLALALQQLEPDRIASYKGKAILVVEATDYPKRSRGKGKQGRHMQHIGRVRKSHHKSRSKGTLGDAKVKKSSGKQKVATTFGYVDVWAGLVLKSKQFFPLARGLFSSNHPSLLSQNQVEEAVLSQALEVLEQIGLKAIAVGDRGLGRKELMVRLATDGQELVFRIDGDIKVLPQKEQGEVILDQLLAGQPVMGRLLWDRGEEGKLECQARQVRATIRYSRSGRRGDYREATLNFVQLVPIEGEHEPLVLATTLPAGTLAEAAGIARVYALRWAIESGFETMKGWGLDAFMVRSWQAMERLLWTVAVAYALMALALKHKRFVRLRLQAIAVLKCLTVLNRQLTVGKLAEAIGLDFLGHPRSWASAWMK